MSNAGESHDCGNAAAAVLRHFAVLRDLRPESLAALTATSKVRTYALGSAPFENAAARTRAHFLLGGSLSLEIGKEIALTIECCSERAQLPFYWSNHPHCRLRVASRQAVIVSIETSLYEALTTWERTGHFEMGHFEVTEIGQSDQHVTTDCISSLIPVADMQQDSGGEAAASLSLHDVHADTGNHEAVTGVRERADVAAHVVEDCDTDPLLHQNPEGGDDHR